MTPTKAAEEANANALPWDEIARLAREADTEARREALAEQIVRERPYMTVVDAWIEIGLARSEPGDVPPL